MNEKNKSPFYLQVLSNIKLKRKNKKIGQKEIASMLSISMSAYVKIENGEITLSVERFLEICRILDVKTYNEILPQINIDSVHHLELALMNAGRSFQVVKQNSMYANRILDTLLERIKSDVQPNRSEIISELEMVGLYIETLQRESMRNGISLLEAKELIDKID